MLVDDWGPETSEEWFSAEPTSWHYEPGEGEKFSALEDSAMGDHVLQVLSDSQGTTCASLLDLPAQDSSLSMIYAVMLEVPRCGLKTVFQLSLACFWAWIVRTAQRSHDCSSI